jgi:hypothetical protein
MIIVAYVIDHIEERLIGISGDILIVFDCHEVLTTLSEQVWQTQNHNFFVEWCNKNVSNFQKKCWAKSQRRL